MAADLWVAWALYWFIAAQSVNAAKSSEGVLLRLTHLVPLASGFFLIFHEAPRPFIYGPLYHAAPLRWLGAALTFAGLLFAVWARVHLGKYWSGIITLKEGHELIRTGPYRLVRHPLYTGFLSAVAGTALAVGTGDALAGFVVILVAYLIKMHREDSLLAATFGESYRLYKKEVRALVPFVY